VAGNKFLVPGLTFVAGVLIWIVFFTMHATGLVFLSTWMRVTLATVTGGLLAFSALRCRLAGGPRLGNVVRAIVLLALAGSALIELGALIAGVLVFAALVPGVLAVLPSGSAQLRGNTEKPGAPDDSWVVLTQHHIPVAWIPIDPGEAQLLFIESELLAAGIEVGFDPRRPGDNYTSRSVAVDLKLLVKQSDLTRAQEILRDLKQESG
jgi:hypothetical protein